MLRSSSSTKIFEVDVLSLVKSVFLQNRNGRLVVIEFALNLEKKS
jgi:hypothetical protein